jgi:hypothetical protein
MSFAIFDENYYLANNSDVKSAVDAGTFSSGRQHFEQFGLAEGRVSVSPFYNEQLYLQKYPDVAAAIAAGGFSSGLQHYIQNGEVERRSPGSFDEQAYLARYPDVAAAVAAGTFSSGLQHYIQFGQFESNRYGWFSGTTENDIITSFGNNTVITGINLQDPVPVENSTTDIRFRSKAGVGEVDTLIGGTGRDFFQLGSSVELRSVYVGNGSADYALIQNFEPGTDAIRLGGSSSSEYNLQAVNGNLNISTASGDLVGIVEGVTSLSQLRDSNPGVLFLG